MFLNRPGANAAQRGELIERWPRFIGQRVAAGMPEHVRVDVKSILASSPARASNLAKPDGVATHCGVCPWCRRRVGGYEQDVPDRSASLVRTEPNSHQGVEPVAARLSTVRPP